MATRTRRVGSTRTYILRGDPGHPDRVKADKVEGREPEEPTRWEIGPLDAHVAARIKDMLTEYTASKNEEADARAKVNYHESAIETCRFGIHGVENLVDEDGEVIPFEREFTYVKGRKYPVATRAFLGRVALKDLVELAREIEFDNFITEADQGNS